jgi:acetylornithine deacetylase/succinyl-diaminopimelate desuccinylase-like protein
VLGVVTFVSLLLIIRNRTFELSPDWRSIDFEAMEEVDLLQRFLQIDTTLKTGSELEGAEFLAGILEGEGVPVEVIDMGNQNANLIATLEGELSEALILHGHLDSDPVPDPDAWAYGPFSGVIDLPWIYGRGAFDMKSVIVAQLMALLEIKRAGIRPARTIVLLSTSSEETDSKLGTLWLLENRPEIFENAWGLLTEGGVVEARNVDDIKYWGTEFEQKRYVKVIVRSPTRPPLEQMSKRIREQGQPIDRLRVTPGVEKFLEVYAQSRDLLLHRELLADPGSLVGDLDQFRQLPGYQQGLFREEIYPFSIVDEKDHFWLRITLALLSDADAEEQVKRLLPDELTQGLDLEVIIEASHAGYSSVEHPLFEFIGEALKGRFGDKVLHGPYYQGLSATDARFYRRAGIPSYGFSPFLALTTETLNISGVNEGLALPVFVDGVDLYRQLVFSIATDSTGGRAQ